jgi:ubiquitin carboxyl-terminal hydrolase 10
MYLVVLHHGEKAEGGHYTTLAFHAGFWLSIDDAHITTIDADEAISGSRSSVPYLLFYRRCDLMQQL